MKTWKLISYFVAIPGILICTYNMYLKEKEHHEHPRAEFVPYSHLRIRSKVGEQCHFFKLCVKVQWLNDQCIGLWVKRVGSSTGGINMLCSGKPEGSLMKFWGTVLVMDKHPIQGRSCNTPSCPMLRKLG